jgi:hypothetical protein
LTAFLLAVLDDNQGASSVFLRENRSPVSEYPFIDISVVEPEGLWFYGQ